MGGFRVGEPRRIGFRWPGLVGRRGVGGGRGMVVRRRLPEEATNGGRARLVGSDDAGRRRSC